MKTDRERKNVLFSYWIRLVGCLILVGGLSISFAVATKYIQTHLFAWGTLTLLVAVSGVFIVSVGIPSKPFRKTLMDMLPSTIIAHVILVIIGGLLAYNQPVPVVYLVCISAALWIFWLFTAGIMTLGGKVGDVFEKKHVSKYTSWA